MENIGLKQMGTFILIYAFVMALTSGIAAIFDAPFVYLFPFTGYVIFLALSIVIVFGVVWDGLCVLLGFSAQTIRSNTSFLKKTSLDIKSTRKVRFFTCGPWPLAMIAMTALIIYGTGNITLISLKLLGTTTEWRDSFFWGIEGELIQYIASLSINVAAWDSLYHSAWTIELFAAFIIILIGRNSSIIYKYCISMIVLFYVGRYLGVLNPVMGPAFYQPEIFTYLNGSITDIAMQSVAEIMSMPPAEAKHESGLLLGGVSAMPSLHLGMVTIAALWLAVASRWTLAFTVPWVLLVWVSTVVLGWHYIIDGAGGIVLGFCCAWATNKCFVMLERYQKSRQLQQNDLERNQVSCSG